MANFRTTHPGRTHAAVHQPIAGHPAPARKVRRGHAPMHMPASGPAAVAASTTADIAAMATYAWSGDFDRIKLHQGFIR